MNEAYDNLRCALNTCNKKCGKLKKEKIKLIKVKKQKIVPI